jgi:hypothetical protein
MIICTFIVCLSPARLLLITQGATDLPAQAMAHAHFYSRKNAVRDTEYALRYLRGM